MDEYIDVVIEVEIAHTCLCMLCLLYCVYVCLY